MEEDLGWWRSLNANWEPHAVTSDMERIFPRHSRAGPYMTWGSLPRSYGV